jgi:hypothetical protein
MTDELHPRHLTHHHRETLEKIFAHPTNHNITWREVQSLLEAVGDVDERHDDRFHIEIAGTSHVLTRPRQKDVAVDMVIDLRGLLRQAGYEPAAS